MGAQMSSMNKVSFEDLQWLIKRNPNNYILINTLGPNDQDCLVKETLPIGQEVETINKLQKNTHIIIYGRNANDESISKKYAQLLSLGFPLYRVKQCSFHSLNFAPRTLPRLGR